MDGNFVIAFKEHLAAQRISFRNGVSRSAIERAENTCGVKFPPDLVVFLSNIAIDDGHFVDWEKITDEQIQAALKWPLEGLCFDIEHNSLWLDSWGQKPETIADRIDAFTAFYQSNTPVLIPVFGHRYIPSAPCEAGNPVYSVYQSDIIVYGADLACYLAVEYKMREFDNHSTPSKSVNFWRNFIS